jgi:LAS superfamily LD-carboxypeptidase LdcB
MKPDLVTRHNNPAVNLSDGGRVRLQSAPMQNLEKLLTDAYNAGVYLKVNSAYRNYSDQVRIQGDVGADAATAGTSNHGFGLAVDLADRKGIKINPNPRGPFVNMALKVVRIVEINLKFNIE